MLKKIIRAIAFIEISIGAITMVSLVTYLLFSASEKPVSVFIFVLISSMISISIGYGFFHHKEWARKTILFFSGYIVLTKILIFSGLLHFNGEVMTFIPTSLKDFISFIYHIFIIFFFNNSIVKRSFFER